MTAKDIESHIHVAAFLATVNDPKQAKCYWEKKTDRTTLAEYIRSTSEADKEMKRVQLQPTTTEKANSETENRQKVKDEPVGKIAKKIDGTEKTKSKSPKNPASHVTPTANAAETQIGPPNTAMSVKHGRPLAKDAKKQDISIKCAQDQAGKTGKSEESQSL